MKLFDATDFIAELTQHIPPKGKHLIRYYGLYASRTKGKSKQDGKYEKFGVKKDSSIQSTEIEQADEYNEVSEKSSKQAWARLIQKVYEVNPLICPKCGSEMRVVSIIMDKEEIKKIKTCIDKKNKSPPVVEKAS